MSIEFGLDIFGDIIWDVDGELFIGVQMICNIVVQVEFVDVVGVDFFGVGEYYCLEFVVFVLEMVFVVIVVCIEYIWFGIVVIVLLFDDFVWVFEWFFILDVLLNGCVEVVFG